MKEELQTQILPIVEAGKESVISYNILQIYKNRSWTWYWKK